MKIAILLILLFLSGDAVAPLAIQTISCLFITTNISPHYAGRLSQCQYGDCGEEPAVRKIPCKLT